MTLAPLADMADLPPSWTDNDKNAKALTVASAAIRDAAGAAITQATTTVTVDGDAGKLLPLPGPLMRDSITAVTVDGIATDRYRVVAEGLWRAEGWTNHRGEPLTVAVSYTFGLAEVPADVADLCIQLAVAWLEHDESGGGITGGVQSVRLDDAQEVYTAEAAETLTPTAIPMTTRRWLRSRFSAGGAVVVGTY